MFAEGSNVLSIAYAPGPRSAKDVYGHLYIAWEQGGKNWIPAACSPYVKIDFNTLPTKKELIFVNRVSKE